MEPDLTPDGAQAALDRADRATGRLHDARLRWVRVGKLGMAALLALVTLAWGLVGPLTLRITLTAAALALVVAWAVVWARADRAESRRDAPRRRLRELDATSLLFLVVVLAGDGVRIDGRDLAGRVWYWLPAALLVATPLLVSALRAPVDRLTGSERSGEAGQAERSGKLT